MVRQFGRAARAEPAPPSRAAIEPQGASPHDVDHPIVEALRPAQVRRRTRTWHGRDLRGRRRAWRGGRTRARRNVRWLCSYGFAAPGIRSERWGRENLI